MIGKRGKLFLFLYMLFLLVLFLMCSTDLIIREPENEIYQIAVIIEDARDDNYGNFRKGMDQAAVEFHADVRFITLYEKLDAAQQLELIRREQQDGADALIIAPVDEEKVAGVLAQKQVTIPVVLLGAELPGEESAGTIAADYQKMGEQIAAQILDDTPEGCPVLFLAGERGKLAGNKEFMEKAVEALTENGRVCKAVTETEETQLRSSIEALAVEEAVIVADDPEMLTMTAALLADDPFLRERVKGLYGRGATMPILNYLDRGVISGVCVTDEFSTGYFSVYMAVQELEGLGSRTSKIMEPYYIEKADLRESPFEKMLFPIE